MIEIRKKQDCCGCNACVQVCPRQCIVLHTDFQGFWYPSVNQDQCVDCHLCEKVCPMSNHGSAHIPEECYSFVHADSNIQKMSSSGGAFSFLSEQILSEGGVVFGAAVTEQGVVAHRFIEHSSQLSILRGSKYVQSFIGDSFVLVKRFLDNNRKVLFSGTPCQISALKLFLRHDYQNLIMVDCFCHGVPSPSIWKEYLDKELSKIKSDLKNRNLCLNAISFRDKTNGWKNYSLSIQYEIEDIYGCKVSHTFRDSSRTNPFLLGFAYDYFLRPACYHCPFKNGRSSSDLTIGDYWGVPKDLDDDKGISLVLVNSSKGKSFIKSFQHLLNKITFEAAVKSNPHYAKSVNKPFYSYSFWKSYKSKGIDCLSAYVSSERRTIKFKLIFVLEHIYYKLYNLLRK